MEPSKVVQICLPRFASNRHALSPTPTFFRPRERRSSSSALNSTLLTVVFHFTLATGVLHLTNNRFMAAQGTFAYGKVWRTPFVRVLGNHKQPVARQPRVELRSDSERPRASRTPGTRHRGVAAVTESRFDVAIPSTNRGSLRTLGTEFKILFLHRSLPPNFECTLRH